MAGSETRPVALFTQCRLPVSAGERALGFAGARALARWSRRMTVGGGRRRSVRLEQNDFAYTTPTILATSSA